MTEGRATGIPTIRKALVENGSPLAVFDTDSDRSFFEVTLKINPGWTLAPKERWVGEKVGEKVGENLTENQRGILKTIYNS